MKGWPHAVTILRPTFLFCVPLRGVIACRFPRGGGVFSFASPKESTQRKGDSGLLETPCQTARAQAPPNSPLANGAGLRQIGVLKPGANRLTRLTPTGWGGAGAVVV